MSNLRNDRRFRRFWAAQAISQFGDRVSELALPLLAIGLLRATPGQIGLLTAAIWLPYLASFLIGSWVDQRRDKRRILVTADLARATVLTSLPIAWLLDVLTLPQVFAVALLNGLGEVFFTTTAPSVFVKLVPRESYLSANSSLSSTRSASFLAGPAIGGVMVQVLTAPVAVLADALSFLASAFLVGRIRISVSNPENRSTETLSGPGEIDGRRELEAEPPTRTEPGGRRVLEGLWFLARHPYLRASLASAATVNFFSFIGSTLLVLFASRTLGMSAGLIGLAFGLGATGGLLGALVAPRLAGRYGVGIVAIFGAFLYPASFALPAVAGGPTALAAGVLVGAEFLGGFGVMLFDVNINSLQASLIPDEMRSRVAGAFSTVNYGVRPLGALTGGLLGTTIGIRPTLVVAAIGGAASCLWLWRSPIRRVRTLADLPLGQLWL